MRQARAFFSMCAGLLVLAAILLPRPAVAAWPYAPAVNVPLCIATGNQYSPTIISDGAGGAIVTWYDYRSGIADIYTQRVARYGYLGTPEAEIVSVRDVPNDQGGRVKLSWNASYLESDPYNLVTCYKVFRSVPPNLAAALRAGGARVVCAAAAEADLFDRPGDLLTTAAAGTTYYWEYIATVNADFLSGYSYLAPAAQDSTGAGAPTTAFMVQSRTAGSQHWESLPMSGYSVDNLAPVMPAPFTGQYAAGTAYLHWNPNPEADLAGYRLHRGDTPGFVPGPGNLVAALPDTGYADSPGRPCYYKLAAVDVHGNVSPYATLLPSGSLDVPGETAFAFALEPVCPNPSSGGTLTVRFTLASAAPAALELLDVAGRRIAAREVGSLGAGHHTLDLNPGVRLAPGLYLVCLRQGASTRVTRAAVIN